MKTTGLDGKNEMTPMCFILFCWLAPSVVPVVPDGAGGFVPFTATHHSLQDAANSLLVSINSLF
jgi:hypothetical protein